LQTPTMVSSPFRLDLVLCHLCALCAGTLYAYSVYAPSLKAFYSQTEVQTIGAVGDLGLYISAFIGRMYDRRGPKTTLRLATVLLAIGYSIMALIVSAGVKNAHAPPAWMLACAFFVVGQGSAASYITGLSTALKLVPVGTRGTISGLVACVFGASSAVFAGISAALSMSSVTFLAMLAATLPLATAGASLSLRAPPPHDADVVVAHGGGGGGDPEGSQPPRIEADLAPRPGGSNGDGGDDGQDGAAQLLERRDSAAGSDPGSESGSSQSAPVQVPDHVTAGTLLRCVDFWLVWASLGIAAGAGLMFINSLSILDIALSGDGGATGEKPWVSGVFFSRFFLFFFFFFFLFFFFSPKF
jgi:MFS family permease